MKLVIIGPYSSIHIQKRIKFFKKKNISFLVIDFYNKYINLYAFNLAKTDLDKIKNYVRDKCYIKINKTKIGEDRIKHSIRVRLRRLLKNIFSDALKNLFYFYFFYKKKLVELILLFAPDIINSHILSSYSYFATHINFSPVICTGWGSDILLHPKRNLIYRYMLISTLKRANGVLVVSLNLKRRIIAKYKYKGNIKIIPLGIDIGLINESKIEKDDNSVIFISTRALEKIYNINLVIKFFYYVQKNYGSNIVLYILNEGSQLYELKKMVSSLGLTDKVKFLGKVNQKKLYKFLKGSDVYLSFASSDGTSVSLLEAMYSGVIVVASDIEANRYWIKHGKNGFLVNLKNIRSSASEIIKILQEIKKYKTKFFKINKKSIETQADLNKNLEQELNFMKEFVSG